jgi:hypothetical protein
VNKREDNWSVGAFAMMFNYVRNLDFEQRPEYGFMKKGLKTVLY